MAYTWRLLQFFYNYASKNVQTASRFLYEKVVSVEKTANNVVNDTMSALVNLLPDIKELEQEPPPDLQNIVVEEGEGVFYSFSIPGDPQLYVVAVTFSATIGLFFSIVICWTNRKQATFWKQPLNTEKSIANKHCNDGFQRRNNLTVTYRTLDSPDQSTYKRYTPEKSLQELKCRGDFFDKSDNKTPNCFDYANENDTETTTTTEEKCDDPPYSCPPVFHNTTKESNKICNKLSNLKTDLPAQKRYTETRRRYLIRKQPQLSTWKQHLKQQVEARKSKVGKQAEDIKSTQNQNEHVGEQHYGLTELENNYSRLKDRIQYLHENRQKIQQKLNEAMNTSSLYSNIQLNHGQTSDKISKNTLGLRAKSGFFDQHLSPVSSGKPKRKIRVKSRGKNKNSPIVPKGFFSTKSTMNPGLLVQSRWNGPVKKVGKEKQLANEYNMNGQKNYKEKFTASPVSVYRNENNQQICKKQQQQNFVKNDKKQMFVSNRFRKNYIHCPENRRPPKINCTNKIYNVGFKKEKLEYSSKVNEMFISNTNKIGNKTIGIEKDFIYERDTVMVNGTTIKNKEKTIEEDTEVMLDKKEHRKNSEGKHKNTKVKICDKNTIVRDKAFVQNTSHKKEEKELIGRKGLENIESIFAAPKAITARQASSKNLNFGLRKTSTPVLNSLMGHGAFQNFRNQDIADMSSQFKTKKDVILDGGKVELNPDAVNTLKLEMNNTDLKNNESSKKDLPEYSSEKIFQDQTKNNPALYWYPVVPEDVYSSLNKSVKRNTKPFMKQKQSQFYNYQHAIGKKNQIKNWSTCSNDLKNENKFSHMPVKTNNENIKSQGKMSKEHTIPCNVYQKSDLSAFDTFRDIEETFCYDKDKAKNEQPKKVVQENKQLSKSACFKSVRDCSCNLENVSSVSQKGAFQDNPDSYIRKKLISKNTTCLKNVRNCGAINNTQDKTMKQTDCLSNLLSIKQILSELNAISVLKRNDTQQNVPSIQRNMRNSNREAHSGSLDLTKTIQESRHYYKLRNKTTQRAKPYYRKLSSISTSETPPPSELKVNKNNCSPNRMGTYNLQPIIDKHSFVEERDFSDETDNPGIDRRHLVPANTNDASLSSFSFKQNLNYNFNLSRPCYIKQELTSKGFRSQEICKKWHQNNDIGTKYFVGRDIRERLNKLRSQFGEAQSYKTGEKDNKKNIKSFTFNLFENKLSNKSQPEFSQTSNSEFVEISKQSQSTTVNVAVQTSPKREKIIPKYAMKLNKKRRLVVQQDIKYLLRKAKENRFSYMNRRKKRSKHDFSAISLSIPYSCINPSDPTLNEKNTLNTKAVAVNEDATIISTTFPVIPPLDQQELNEKDKHKTKRLKYSELQKDMHSELKNKTILKQRGENNNHHTKNLFFRNGQNALNSLLLENETGVDEPVTEEKPKENLVLQNCAKSLTVPALKNTKDATPKAGRPTSKIEREIDVDIPKNTTDHTHLMKNLAMECSKTLDGDKVDLPEKKGPEAPKHGLIRPNWANAKIEEVDRRVERALKLRAELIKSKERRTSQNDQTETFLQQGDSTTTKRELFSPEIDYSVLLKANRTYENKKRLNVTSPSKYIKSNDITDTTIQLLPSSIVSSGIGDIPDDASFEITNQVLNELDHDKEKEKALPRGSETTLCRSNNVHGRSLYRRSSFANDAASKEDRILFCEPPYRVERSASYHEDALSDHDMWPERPLSDNTSSRRTSNGSYKWRKRSGSRNKNSPPTKISKVENNSLNTQPLIGELVQRLPHVPLSSFVEWFIETSDPNNFVLSEKSSSSSENIRAKQNKNKVVKITPETSSEQTSGHSRTSQQVKDWVLSTPASEDCGSSAQTLAHTVQEGDCTSPLIKDETYCHQLTPFVTVDSLTHCPDIPIDNSDTPSEDGIKNFKHIEKSSFEIQQMNERKKNTLDNDIRIKDLSNLCLKVNKSGEKNNSHTSQNKVQRFIKEKQTNIDLKGQYADINKGGLKNKKLDTDLSKKDNPVGEYLGKECDKQQSVVHRDGNEVDNITKQRGNQKFSINVSKKANNTTPLRHRRYNSVGDIPFLSDMESSKTAFNIGQSIEDSLQQTYNSTSCGPNIRQILMKLENSNDPELLKPEKMRITLRKSSEITGIIAKFQRENNDTQ